MTDFVHNVPPPPDPLNYEVTYSRKASVFPWDNAAGSVTCTECGDTVRGELAAEDVNDQAGHVSRVTRHNTQKHPELLSVYTSAGWLRADYLVAAIMKPVSGASG